MRINPENKSVDMEQRDINYILPPYIKNYQFYNKNELPDRIIFPMFPAINMQGADGKMHLIPIEYIAHDSPVAIEIAEDGADLTEVTPAQEAVLDEKEEEIKRLKAEVEALTQVGGTTGTSKQDMVSGTTIPSTEEEPQSLADEMPDEEPEVSPARTAFAETPTPASKPERIPKQPPGGDIGTGQPLSNMHPRDDRDQAMTAKALQQEPDISGSEEKPFEKEISRDNKGNPVVEDKPDET